MGNFDANLYRALSICDGDFRYLSEYSKVYTFTTENISGYIEYLDLTNKSLLTVGSSGDQILNAFYCGARDITLYDINPFAKYYIYLKIASILSLNYTEFQQFFYKHGLNGEYNNHDMFSIELFSKIKDNLRLFDYESFLFFDEIFTTCDKKKIRDYLFDDDEFRNQVIKGFNIYLRDEESYNQLKSIIKKITFKHINGNIFEDTVPGKYDNIILSNLCTITSIEEFKELLVKLDSNNLNQNGSIMFGYLWNIDFNSTSMNKDWKDIYKIPLVKEYLKEFISEYYKINNDRDFIWDKNDKSDLCLIYRK